MRIRPQQLRRTLDGAWARIEDRPVVVVIAASGATLGTAIVLGTAAGWPHVLQLVESRRSWLWLLVCLGGELTAYAGYVLAVRDMARVDNGPELDLNASVATVVGGFGVFAATRSSGGFAVDYWAFRRAGAGRREAAHRVLGLGFLEYVVLSVVALVASVALALNFDGHASLGVTLPGLTIIPALALAWWATSPKRVHRLRRPRPSRLRGMLANAVAGAHYVRQLFTNPREHGLGVLGNAIYWAGDIGCLAAALALCGVSISWARLVLAYSGGYVLTRRALPAGGAGFVEAALTVALAGMGVGLTRALVAVVIYRLFNFWLPIVPALFLMPALSELRRRFRAAEPA
jgi:uncharacterized membrane protein YbhN (UPF0104 family)